MDSELPHNPFLSPEETSLHADIEAATVLLPSRRFPTPLFRWTIAIFLFEAVLAPIHLRHTLWPQYVPNPPRWPVCHFLNTIILCLVSWNIGRRFRVLNSLWLSQLIHIATWLMFILVFCLLLNWEFDRREWKSALQTVACSALINGLVAAVASTWFRAKKNIGQVE